LHSDADKPNHQNLFKVCQFLANENGTLFYGRVHAVAQLSAMSFAAAYQLWQRSVPQYPGKLGKILTPIKMDAIARFDCDIGAGIDGGYGKRKTFDWKGAEQVVKVAARHMSELGSLTQIEIRADIH
jgi:hypothetical protein